MKNVKKKKWHDKMKSRTITEEEFSEEKKEELSAARKPIKHNPEAVKLKN